jgi:tetratricopeptide (TPR) repeat protein
MNTRRSALLAILFTGLLVLSACSGGNPNINAAEDALDDGNYDQAISSAQTALDTDSSNTEAYLLISRAYINQVDSTTSIEERQRLFQKAREAQEKALEFDPSLQDDVQGRRTTAYYQQMQSGIDAFNQARQTGDSTAYRNAASFFGGAATLEPDSVEAHLNEAFARLNIGQRTESIEPLETYVTKADSVGETPYTILGQLYLTNDRTEDAIAVLQEATQQYPENTELQSLLLNAFNRTDDKSRAMQAYRDQIEKNPNNAQFRYNYGSLLLTAERYDDAIEQLQRAADLDSDNPRVYYNLGAAHINKAAAIDDSITTIEDEAREADRDMTDSEQSTLDELVSKRTDMFENAIPALEKAYQMTSTGDEYRQDICRALFQVYVNTDKEDKAKQVESCAGMADSGSTE